MKARGFAPRAKLPLVLETGKGSDKAKKITFGGRANTIPAASLNKSKAVLIDNSDQTFYNPEDLFDPVNTSCASDRSTVFKNVVPWMGNWVGWVNASKAVLASAANASEPYAG